MTSSLNDKAWIKIFDEYSIVHEVQKNGQFVISSTQINKFGREARLMTKFDYKFQLPLLFAENNFSILPISRGTYVIGEFETFHVFDNCETDVTKIAFPSYLESLDYKNITSEATALNCAYITGIIEDFVQDEDLRPTVNGRMSSAAFSFDINSQNSLKKVAV